MSKMKRLQLKNKLKQKNIKKLPLVKHKDKKFFGKSLVRIALRKSALERRQIQIKYKKTTTNDVKDYLVSPYSYRYKKLKIGIRKMLYAYDMKEKSIKMFSLRNIFSVMLTNKKYEPKWPIEIK